MGNSYQPDSRFSIHTFLLRRRITGVMWKNVMDLIYENQKIHNDPRLIENELSKGNRTLIYKEFKDQGIIIYLKWVEESIRITNLHSIELKINPRRLIGDNTYVGVFDFTYSNMKDLDKILSRILLDIGFAGSNGLESFELSRIDLCMNLYIENIDMFINAVRKCRTPKGFKKLRYKNKKIPTNSAYLMSDAMTVHIYSKQHQMLKEKYDLRQDELDKAENLARFEVQLHRPKIYELMQQGKLPYKFEGYISSFFVALGCSAPQILVDTASKIFGMHPYYSLESMQARIHHSDLKTKTKEKMMSFLHLIALLHDTDKAFIEMKKQPENEKVKIKDLIKNFRN